MAAAAERGASLGEACGVWVSFQESLVQRNRFAERGKGNGRARSTGEEFRSHRHAGLRQQLQCTGQADMRGHGQQPARIVPVMGPLEEQHRFFISPKPWMVSSRHLHHSRLQARALQQVFPRSFCASALGSANRTRVRARVSCASRLQSAPASSRCKGGLCRQELDCVNPKGLPRPRQEVVLCTSKVEKYKVAIRL